MATKKKLTAPEGQAPATPEVDLPASPDTPTSEDAGDPVANTDTNDTSTDATEQHVEGADIPEELPNEEPNSSGDEASADEDARDEDAPEQTNAEAQDAFASIAQQLLQDLDLPVVFLTTDGTAFYGYSDALNYAQTLPQKDVRAFLAGSPSDEEIRQLLPPNLRPKHLREDE